MEQEKTEIESLIGNYVKRWPYAVNYGDDYYFADYIHKRVHFMPNKKNLFKA